MSRLEQVKRAFFFSFVGIVVLSTVYTIFFTGGAPERDETRERWEELHTRYLADPESMTTEEMAFLQLHSQPRANERDPLVGP